MKIIKAKAEIIIPTAGIQTVPEYLMSQMKMVELVGRTCYKSEDNITDNSYEKFINNLIIRGHEAMLEHGGFTVRYIVDRGVSHELVRHRLASWAQESTRYCNYSKDKFGNECTFIQPFWLKDADTEEYKMWHDAMSLAESKYMSMLYSGQTPQQARSVLPNSLKTEVIMTANFREWRAFFKLRADKPAHPQMKEVVVPLFMYLKEHCQPVFGNIDYDEDFMYGGK